MLTKAAPVKVKAGPDAGLDDGQFEAIVSVFGNVDSDGDRVVKGAFAKSLEQWAESGDPMPVIWTHDHRNPFSHIGVVTDAKETDEGLVVKGQLDIADDLENPTAKQVYRLLKGGRVRNWSYTYDVLESEQEKDGINKLLELGVHEVGPTLIGSNRDTETLAIKSDARPLSKSVAQLVALLDDDPALVDHLKSVLADGKSGRVLSAKNETSLRSALDQIGEGAEAIKSVLAQIGEPVDDQEKASGANGPAEDEDAERVKSSEPSPSPSARVLAAHRQLSLEGALHEHSH